MKSAEKIYAVVKAIPRGKVAMYKHVAKRAGLPRSARHVGNVLGKNNNACVPCHRVVRSDRSVGGYRDGTRKKIARLTEEGVHITGGRVAREDILE